MAEMKKKITLEMDEDEYNSVKDDLESKGILKKEEPEE